MGYSRASLTQNKDLVKGLIHPDDRAIFESQLQALSAGERGTLHCELRFRTKSGDYRRFELRGGAVRTDRRGNPIEIAASVYDMQGAVAHDIPKRKHPVEGLQESEEHLRLAIELDHLYAFEWDPVSDSVRRSQQSERILGIGGKQQQQGTAQEFIGMLFPDDKETYRDTMRSLTSENPTFRAVFRLRRPDGSILWLEKFGRALFDQDGKIVKVYGFATDVTEVRESERVLRELIGRLIATQEEERRRIARELHDHIGQELALLCVQAQRIASGKSEPSNAPRNEAHDLHRRVKDIATDVSKLSHRLHATELDFLGLAPSAERLCHDFSNQYGLPVDFTSKNVPPKLDINKTRCFFRVLQEALQNVAKHSRATHVTVQLEKASNQLVLNVIDNGIGFDTEKVRFGSGFGLVSIRERLRLVGGRFTLTSRSGESTTLAAFVPV